MSKPEFVSSKDLKIIPVGSTTCQVINGVEHWYAVHYNPDGSIADEERWTVGRPKRRK